MTITTVTAFRVSRIRNHSGGDAQSAAVPARLGKLAGETVSDCRNRLAADADTNPKRERGTERTTSLTLWVRGYPKRNRLFSGCHGHGASTWP